MTYPPDADDIARYARRFRTLTDESNLAIAAEVLRVVKWVHADDSVDELTVCSAINELHNRVARAHPDGSAADPEVRGAVIQVIEKEIGFDITAAWPDYIIKSQGHSHPEQSKTPVTMHPEHDCEDCGIYHTFRSSHSSGAAPRRLVYVPTETREWRVVDGNQCSHFEN
jgi:hypothetical protein